MKLFPALLISICILVLSSCSQFGPQPSGLEVYNDYDRPAIRAADPSAIQVKVSTSRQRAYVMENGKPLLVMPISVGFPDHHPTPAGHFKVLEKDRYKRTPKHGFAYSGDKTRKLSRHNKPAGWSFKGTPLPYWVEFKPGYGFHTGWIKHTPCTWDGCIRMHRNVAPKFFQLVQKDTPVHIADSQPEDAEYGSIPLPPDAGPLPDYPDAYYLTDKPFTDHKEPVLE